MEFEVSGCLVSLSVRLLLVSEGFGGEIRQPFVGEDLGGSSGLGRRVVADFFLEGKAVVDWFFVRRLLAGSVIPSRGPAFVLR